MRDGVGGDGSYKSRCLARGRRPNLLLHLLRPGDPCILRRVLGRRGRDFSLVPRQRLRVQEEFLAEQFDNDRLPMSPMSDGSPEHSYRVFSPYDERRQRTITTTSPEV